MARLTFYNKLFLALMALLIVLIIWKVPHEKDEPVDAKAVPSGDVKGFGF